MTDEIPLAVLAKYVPKGGVIVELGAHQGATMRTLCEAFAPSKYIAVEADPRNVAGLEAVQFELMTGPQSADIEVYAPIAVVGSGADTVTLHQSDAARRKGSRAPWTFSSSVCKPTAHIERFPHVTFNTKVEVCATSLAALLDMAEIASVDLLWMDIEGAERQVLEQFDGLGHLKDVAVINMEAHPESLHEGAWSRLDASVWLGLRGFKVVAEADQDILAVRV